MDYTPSIIYRGNVLTEPLSNNGHIRHSIVVFQSILQYTLILSFPISSFQFPVQLLLPSSVTYIADWSHMPLFLPNPPNFPFWQHRPSHELHSSSFFLIFPCLCWLSWVPSSPNIYNTLINRISLCCCLIVCLICLIFDHERDVVSPFGTSRNFCQNRVLSTYVIFQKDNPKPYLGSR
jgi:hypothetical protein